MSGKNQKEETSKKVRKEFLHLNTIGHEIVYILVFRENSGLHFNRFKHPSGA